jgi:hypothetical protein
MKARGNSMHGRVVWMQRVVQGIQRAMLASGSFAPFVEDMTALVVSGTYDACCCSPHP